MELHKPSVLISVILALRIASLAQAASSDICAKPPYGDTQQAYIEMSDIISNAEVSSSLPTGALATKFELTMRMACQAKFQHGDRTLFYKAGMTDQAIDTLTTGRMTKAWMNARNDAHDADMEKRCESPPYGDSESNFKRFIQRYGSIDPTSTIAVIRNVCRAKLNIQNRDPLYSVGLTDADIDRESTMELASNWLRKTLKQINH